MDVPGVPPGVEVRTSARRRRTVTAYRERGRTVVLVPARMPRAQILGYVQELVGRLEARERRASRSDADLQDRAAELSRRYLPGGPLPASVRWVDNQERRWGSCTPLDASIRLSSRLQQMPRHVIDYVLLHELAHLQVAGHGPDFHALLTGYPKLAEAQAFLAGVDHAILHGLTGVVASSPEAPPQEPEPSRAVPSAPRPAVAPRADAPPPEPATLW